MEYNIDKKERNFEVQVYDNKVNIKFFIVKFTDSKNVYMVEDGSNAEWIGNLNETKRVIVPKNLIYDLENSYIRSKSLNCTCSIENDIITITANDSAIEGYAVLTKKIYLYETQKYYFKMDTDGIYGDDIADKVSAWLLLNGNSDPKTASQMTLNPCSFKTKSTSGVYNVRLDVNKKGKTHTFTNISINLIIE